MVRVPSAVALSMLVLPALAQTTTRVSVSSHGAQGDAPCSGGCSVSADGRRVAFLSAASDLVPGGTPGRRHVYVRDRVRGTTTRVSANAMGAEGDADSYAPAISGDGRFVAFTSLASNLVPGDTNGWEDVFLADLELGSLSRVSVGSTGAQADVGSGPFVAVSENGRFVAFESAASNLVVGDTNGVLDVFVHDCRTGATERVSIDGAGVQGNGDSRRPSISADGRFVAYWSWASNLVAGDTNGSPDAFLRDRRSGTTVRVSVDSAGVEGNSWSGDPALSADGSRVAFTSLATNLAPQATNGHSNVYFRDLARGTTSLVSSNAGEISGNQDSEDPCISADGRHVAFASEASNLVPGDDNGAEDVFVKDVDRGTIDRASRDPAWLLTFSPRNKPAISADGRFVAFLSGDAQVPDDTNVTADVFLRDRIGGTQFESSCWPGADGAIACPCANPPAGVGRGCDNSAGTGGATLSAAGATSLSSDSLVFTTSGEQPTATSVLLQGTTVLASGAVYGQGVRCVGGTLNRLFTKTASNGSVTAPDFVAGDPAVSARSAAKGNPIFAGESRWYLVVYRDPTVLGGCASGSTFNATQTGRIDWAP